MPRLSKIGAAALAAFGWTSGTSAVTASYLVVAGGGSGGYGDAGASGGGGAGGLLTGSLSLNQTLSYTVIVGAGGGAITGYSIGNNGSNSVFSSITSTGGGGGGQGNGTTANGANGGSGGGGGEASATRAGGTGISGQGNNGGGGANTQAAGGGGGAGAAGATGTYSPAVSGAGGVGLASSISGTSTFYAGGGGGAVYLSGTRGAGGSGGGGAGANGAGLAAGAGTANTGGGGGGGSRYGSPEQPSGAGGSGIVIISYLGAQQFSGGVVTSVGGNTIHTFTTSGTLGPITTLSASYLIVAGGGGGGTGGLNNYNGGAGGAGGLLSGSGLTIDPNSTYLVTVGAGGATNVAGSNSAFNAYTSIGGGQGATGSQGATGGNGGSGGGGASHTGGGSNNGTGTSGQGNNGGSGSSSGAGGVYGSGGGGGASAVGSNGTSSSGGNGGAGTASSISGSSVTYAGGGGGSASSGSAGTGGAGGGGNGGVAAVGSAGTANLGGGGGAGSGLGASYAGGAGGSGVVIISYAGSTQQMAGGTVTIVGGNVIHTFTSTGYLTPIKYSTGSLRMRSSNSAYLSRTPTVAGNRQKFTISMWVKRGDLTARQGIIAAGTTNLSSLPGGAIYFDNTAGGNGISIIGAGGTSYSFTTTQKFRDPAAWYHLVFAWDTTQAINTNRFIMYVNGLPVTSFASATYPTQNFSTDYNNTIVQGIGTRTDDGALPASPFDGEMTEVYMIDGQQLTPSSFGTFNSYGVWQPITYGGSYGTNGFYLPFNRQAVSYVGSFSGSNYLSATATSAIGTSSFTTECYAYINSAPAALAMFVDTRSTDTNGSVIYIDSSRLLVLGAGTNFSTSSTVTLSLNRWYHLAVVRSGSTVTGYVNGTAVISYTDSTNLSSTQLRIGTNYNAAYSLNGYISNARVVNGTAVYTSNFVPSTSALTAVSGTTILTLQNSSIIDNSGNSLSITNTGGVSTGQTYPFAYGIFNDQGPAGNNWTPSGISGAFGSTLDYLGDAPTLTSATVANYCTINPLDGVGTATISDGNLKFTCTGANATFRGTMGMAGGSGKWYWEFTQQTAVGSLNPISYGISTLQGPPSHTGTRSAYYYTDLSGKYFVIYNNGVQTYFSVATAIAINEVLQFAYDSDTGKVWIGKGGVWSDSSGGTTGNPATGANPTYTFASVDQPMTPTFDHAGVSYTASLNCGQQPFQNTPPSGFVALNAFNL